MHCKFFTVPCEDEGKNGKLLILLISECLFTTSSPQTYPPTPKRPN